MFPINSCCSSASNNMENSSAVTGSWLDVLLLRWKWQACFPLNFWDQIYFIYTAGFQKGWCFLGWLRKRNKIAPVCLLPVFWGSQTPWKYLSWWSLHEARAPRAGFWQHQAPSPWRTSGKGFFWCWVFISNVGFSYLKVHLILIYVNVHWENDKYSFLPFWLAKRNSLRWEQSWSMGRIVK